MIPDPKNNPLHALYVHYTTTLRYSPDDPDLFLAMRADPSFPQDGYEAAEADAEAEYEAGRADGYAQGRADGYAAATDKYEAEACAADVAYDNGYADGADDARREERAR